MSAPLLIGKRLSSKIVEMLGHWKLGATGTYTLLVIASLKALGP